MLPLLWKLKFLSHLKLKPQSPHQTRKKSLPPTMKKNLLRSRLMPPPRISVLLTSVLAVANGLADKPEKDNKNADSPNVLLLHQDQADQVHQEDSKAEDHSPLFKEPEEQSGATRNTNPADAKVDSGTEPKASGSAREPVVELLPHAPTKDSERIQSSVPSNHADAKEESSNQHQESSEAEEHSRDSDHTETSEEEHSDTVQDPEEGATPLLSAKESVTSTNTSPSNTVDNASAKTTGSTPPDMAEKDAAPEVAPGATTSTETSEDEQPCNTND